MPIDDNLLNDLQSGITGRDLEDKYDVEDAQTYVEQLQDDGYSLDSVYVSSVDENLYMLSESPQADVTNHVEKRRQTSAAKQTITKHANEYLSELEEEIKGARQEMDPVLFERGQQAYEPGNEDVVFHRSDDHFGDVVKDQDGNVIYDTELAAERVREAFDKMLDADDARSTETDTAHLLLGGDHVTNEAIYDAQPHHIDALIDEQLNTATAVYDDVIDELAEKYDAVQVVCQAGNHGEFRIKGASSASNADGLMYDRLEMLARKGDYDNVQFVKSDRKDNVNFEMRDWRGHLRHGNNVNNHIGTSSPRNTWGAFLNEYDFDIAYRGHYHTCKEEEINGVPVLMAPSQKPGGEFEGIHAIFGNGPETYVHWVSDDTPLSGKERIPLEEV